MYLKLVNCKNLVSMLLKCYHALFDLYKPPVNRSTTFQFKGAAMPKLQELELPEHLQICKLIQPVAHVGVGRNEASLVKFESLKCSQPTT